MYILLCIEYFYLYFSLPPFFAKDIIAVLDLEQIGLTPQEAQILTERLTRRLISLNKYQVVERNNMDKIVKEHYVAIEGYVSCENFIKIGDYKVPSNLQTILDEK